MKYHWGDESTQRNKNVPSDAWSLRAKGFRISVHNYVGFDPRVWFVSCPQLGIDRSKLLSKTGEEAKVEAIAHLLEVLRGHVADLKKIWTDTQP